MLHNAMLEQVEEGKAVNPTREKKNLTWTVNTAGITQEKASCLFINLTICWSVNQFVDKSVSCLADQTDRQRDRQTDKQRQRQWGQRDRQSVSQSVSWSIVQSSDISQPAISLSSSSKVLTSSLASLSLDTAYCLTALLVNWDDNNSNASSTSIGFHFPKSSRAWITQQYSTWLKKSITFYTSIGCR